MNNRLLYVFVDTDAFVAAMKQDDPNHQRAKELFEKLKPRSTSFMTSNYVLAEVITVLSQRVSHEVAVGYMDTMTSVESTMMIHQVDAALDTQAREIFRVQTSKNISYVDCTNIALVRSLDLDAIFSFDGAYRKNKLPLVEDLLAEEHPAA